MNETSKKADVVDDLVCSMLAVNVWTLEKSFAIREELEREVLFDVERMNSMTLSDFFDALKRAGYSKADFVVGLFVNRLSDMARVLSARGIERLCELIHEKETRAIDECLLPINGVGPKVCQNFGRFGSLHDAEAGGIRPKVTTLTTRPSRLH